MSKKRGVVQGRSYWICACDMENGVRGLQLATAKVVKTRVLKIEGGEVYVVRDNAPGFTGPIAKHKIELFRFTAFDKKSGAKARLPIFKENIRNAKETGIPAFLVLGRER